MNVPARIAPCPITAADVFRARAEARALLWRCSAFDLHEGVDILQIAAKRTGLIDQIGQDRVQAIIARAFHQMRDSR
jgi:hypothetical protein